uniref:Uncharacterized protein n=1 Tax=Anguilla anguilla TaxID=7936 RepID=A0A0E9T7N1_ANGAN
MDPVGQACQTLVTDLIYLSRSAAAEILKDVLGSIGKLVTRAT